MILRDIRLARAADEIELADLTDATRTGAAYWDPTEVDALVMPLDPEPSAADAKAIRRRLVTENDASERHLRDLLNAHGDPQAPSWARMALAAEIGRYGDPADLA